MFYWSILQKSENELIRRFLTAQELNPVKNDLCTQFKDDLKTCGISLEISKLKKWKFKKIVNNKLQEVAREYLISLKESHSKLDQLRNTYTLEPYLTSNNLTTEEKQTLFKLRTRMIDVKCNFKSYVNSVLRRKHSLVCKETVDIIDTSDYSYDDVFEDLEKQEAIAKIYTRILQRRTMKLKILRNLSN